MVRMCRPGGQSRPGRSGFASLRPRSGPSGGAAFLELAKERRERLSQDLAPPAAAHDPADDLAADPTGREAGVREPQTRAVGERRQVEPDVRLRVAAAAPPPVSEAMGWIELVDDALDDAAETGRRLRPEREPV